MSNLCKCCIALFTLVFLYVLKSGIFMTLFFLKVVLAILVTLPLHINCRINLFNSVKKLTGILVGYALYRFGENSHLFFF